MQPPEEDDPSPLEEAEDLRSRTDERKERQRAEQQLLDLAKRLVELPERTLAKLDLAEDLLDAIQRARAIHSAPARMRALRVVRTALRDGAAGQIQKRLAMLARPRASEPNALHQWCERLQAGGDGELTAFLELHPDADRKQLRQLVRRAAKADAAAKPAAVSALKRALGQHVK